MMCIVILLGFPCWLIRHCSSGVPSALPLLLRSAAWRCALHIQFQLSYLLHTAQHRFRPTGSCCARAASVAAQSLLSTSILHSFLQTSFLCDQGEFWSSKLLAVWSCCCWQVRPCCAVGMQANQSSSTGSCALLCLPHTAGCYASMAVCLQAVLICCKMQMLRLYHAQLRL